MRPIYTLSSAIAENPTANMRVDLPRIYTYLKCLVCAVQGPRLQAAGCRQIQSWILELRIIVCTVQTTAGTYHTLQSLAIHPWVKHYRP